MRTREATQVCLRFDLFWRGARRRPRFTHTHGRRRPRFTHTRQAPPTVDTRTREAGRRLRFGLIFAFVCHLARGAKSRSGGAPARSRRTGKNRYIQFVYPEYPRRLSDTSESPIRYFPVAHPIYLSRLSDISESPIRYIRVAHPIHPSRLSDISPIRVIRVAYPTHPSPQETRAHAAPLEPTRTHATRTHAAARARARARRLGDAGQRKDTTSRISGSASSLRVPLPR